MFNFFWQGEDGKPLYTQFDDNGVPTHDAAGEAIVKNKVSQENNHVGVRIFRFVQM